VHLNPQNVDQIFVCTRAPTIFLMTLQGQVGRAGSLCTQQSDPARMPCLLCHAAVLCCRSIKDASRS